MTSQRPDSDSPSQPSTGWWQWNGMMRKRVERPDLRPDEPPEDEPSSELAAASAREPSARDAETDAHADPLGPLAPDQMRDSFQSEERLRQEHEVFGAGTVIDWIVWSLATAIPVFSAAAWLTMAFRRRRRSLSYETIMAAIWPLLSVFIFSMFVVFVFLVSYLLLSQYGIDEEYRQHTLELVQYHESYHWVGTGSQLGDEGLLPPLVEHESGSLIAAALEAFGGWLALALLPAMWLASVVHAQRQWFRRFPAPPPRGGDDRLFISALLLWMFFGWTGAHRFYLRRWISGLFYLFSFGGFGIGWGADVFGLRAAVDQANTAPGSARRLAPWAADTRFGVLDYLPRLIYYVIAPGSFAFLCVRAGHYELLLVLLFTLIVCGLFGDVHRSLQSFRWLHHLPFTRPATQVAQQLYDFYSVNRPRSFWFYLFSPITAPIAFVCSQPFRAEARLFGIFLRTIVGAVLINQFRQVMTTYQYHSPLNIAFFILLHLVVATTIASVMLTPILTTTYTYNLSGRVRRLRVLSIAALCVTMFCVLSAVGEGLISQRPSVISYMLIRERMRDPTFQEQLTQSSRLFLEHYIERTPRPLDEMYPLASHPKLSERYRQEVLAALAPADEGKVFRVFTMAVEGDLENAWVGVGMLLGEDDTSTWRTLFLMSPRHEFYTAWDETLPPRIREDFETAADLWNIQYEHRLARRDPHHDLALYRTTESTLRSIQVQLTQDQQVWRERAERCAYGPHHASPLMQSMTSGSGPPTAFDPEATTLLRNRLASEWGDEALRFRVFLLPAVTEDGWWLGVMDGDDPLCLLAPWGDFFRDWDREIFARYRNVLGRFDAMQRAYQWRTSIALTEDYRRSRARLLLSQLLYDPRDADQMQSLLTPYVASSESQADWSLKQLDVAETPLGSQTLGATLDSTADRWLYITIDGAAHYAMSPQGRFYFRDATGLVDVAGNLLPQGWPARPPTELPWKPRVVTQLRERLRR